MPNFIEIGLLVWISKAHIHARTHTHTHTHTLTFIFLYVDWIIFILLSFSE